MDMALTVTELTKKYDDLVAVNKVSFSVKLGACYGILGPNGAGKTTLLEMIEGVIPVTSGSITVLGMDHARDLQKILSRIGVQLQENNYFNFLNVEQLIRFFSSLYDNKGPTIDSLLEVVSLSHKRKARIEQLSGGQKQRFALAVTLVGDPEIVFLDEPTTGLDPQNRRSTWELIKQLKEKRKTIILTTHYMEEAEILCDDLLIIDQGKKIAEGTPRQLIQSMEGTYSISFQGNGREFQEEEIQALVEVKKWRRETEDNTWKVWSDKPAATIQSLYQFAEKNRAEITQLSTDQATLEDVFLYLTGRRLRD